MVIHAFLSFIITLFMSHTYGTLSEVYEFPCNMMDPSSSANLLQVYAFFSFFRNFVADATWICVYI